MIRFIRDVVFDIQKKSIQRKLDQYKILLDAGIDEKTDKMIDLQIEIAEGMAHFKSIYGEGKWK